jgi:hypothetical protein
MAENNRTSGNAPGVPADSASTTTGGGLMGKASRRRGQYRNSPDAIMQEIPAGKIPTEYPAFKGDHEWVMSANYRVNPLAVQLGGEAAFLDRESLIYVAGPLCIHCGNAWPPPGACNPIVIEEADTPTEPAG